MIEIKLKKTSKDCKKTPLLPKPEKRHNKKSARNFGNYKHSQHPVYGLGQTYYGNTIFSTAIFQNNR